MFFVCLEIARCQFTFPRLPATVDLARFRAAGLRRGQDVDDICFVSDDLVRYSVSVNSIEDKSNFVCLRFFKRVVNGPVAGFECVREFDHVAFQLISITPRG